MMPCLRASPSANRRAECGSEIRGLEIDLCLLGPYHDRRIHLHYVGVRQYSFVTPPHGKSIAHGDLFAHEVRLGETGLVVHELGFANGAKFIIECFDFKHSEEPIISAS